MCSYQNKQGCCHTVMELNKIRKATDPITDLPGLRLVWFRFGLLCLRFREIQSSFRFFLLEKLQRESILLQGTPLRRSGTLALQS